MKNLFITVVILTGLVIILWGAGRYILQKIELQQQATAFALSEGHGETEEQKQQINKLKKTLRTTALILAGGGFLIFMVISHLNKPANNVLKKTTHQL
jgi:TRAP-type C4-dicarboxylate transport system permease small subunit